MRSENELIAAVGMAYVQKVFQKPFRQLGMQASIQFVDDENSPLRFLQLCKGGDEIQKSLRTIGFFIQLKSDVLAVKVFMNGKELFENQFIIFHSNDDIIASIDVVRAAHFFCLIPLNNFLGNEESISASLTVSKWSMPVP